MPGGSQLDAAPQGTRVRLDDTLGDLVGSKPDESRVSNAVTPPLEVFWRLVTWAATILAIGVALLFVYRRFVSVRVSSKGVAAVRVVGRTALSSRHSVYLIRIGGRLVAVGVSGDRMTKLAQLDESDFDSEPGLGEQAPEDGARSPLENSAERRSLVRRPSPR